MTTVDVALHQIVAATSATLQFQGVDSDGEPADPGTVTVTVRASDGTAIVTDAATDGTSTDPRTVDLTPAQTAQVDRISAEWTSGGVALAVTFHDVVGGVLVSVAEFKRREPKRATESVADVVASRFTVDALFRRATHRSFVPRFDTATVSVVNGVAVLPHPDVREVRWATTQTETAVDVSSLTASTSGVICDVPSSGWITFGYVHGMSAPPSDVVEAACTTIAADIVDGRSSIPRRVETMQTDLVTTSFVPRPGYGRAVTAIDTVDEVLNGYAWDVPGVA